MNDDSVPPSNYNNKMVYWTVVNFCGITLNIIIYLSKSSKDYQQMGLNDSSGEVKYERLCGI